MQYTVTFPNGPVQYLMDTPFAKVEELVSPKDCIIITDTNIHRLYKQAFEGYKAVIVIPADESSKSLETVADITQQLLAAEAHRKTYLLGVGGGMVTDVTGLVASLYMRGMPFGFVPTSLLGMVDASIGGKNGVNFGMQKNLLGTFTQPDFILFDYHFLKTLPIEEWSNGFAEIIKYACLFDNKLFDELMENDLRYYHRNIPSTAEIVAKCVNWKNDVVISDERESWTRKLLNFGHTAGHAFETVCEIPHGQAVAIGMLVADRKSVV